MTREEASNILDDFDVNFAGHTAEEIAEAFDVAFKALSQEQQPILDKIRAEQKALITINSTPDYSNGVMNCLNIIDKCMAESEEQTE